MMIDIPRDDTVLGLQNRINLQTDRIKWLEMVLEDTLQYFEDHSDVVDGDYGMPKPNREMNFASMIKEALGRDW